MGRYPGTKVSSVAAFVQADYALTPKWHIQGGARYQYLNNEIDDFVAYSIQKKIAAGNGVSADAVPGGETDYHVGLFNLGTIYSLTPASQLWANFSQGFDLADPAKYYGQGEYADMDANGHYALLNSINVDGSRMSGIKTNSVEVGYRFDNADLSVQAATYYSQSDKSVSYNKQTMLIESVDDKRRVYGTEAQLTYWFNTQLQFGASGHLVMSEVKQDGDWNKMSAGEASASKASAWAVWYDDELTLKLQSQTMFHYSDDQDNKLDGFTLFDLAGNYQLPVGTLGFGIQNLLNNDYTTLWGQRAQILYSTHYAPGAYDYKGRGRTYTLNYQVRF